MPQPLPAPAALPHQCFPAVRRRRLTTLQVNIGLRCNQACLHCHVNSNPYRREKMSGELIDLIIQVLPARRLHTLDLTGGAPEMHPEFKRLVTAARALGVTVIDRCNLTILEQPGYEDMAEFLAQQQVEIIASLPCYSQENVDQQRGDGVFAASIKALQQLNRLGYGHANTNLRLSLVYNPLGPHLPPPQAELAARYKKELHATYGIVFDQLFTLTNMPINRFGKILAARGQLDNYLTLLKSAHNGANLHQVMCRDLVSVDWQGYLYDCDFNQMLGLHIPTRPAPRAERAAAPTAPAAPASAIPQTEHAAHGIPVIQADGSGNRGRLHLRDLLRQDLTGQPVTVRDHCFGCTAGQGSSCGGALAI